MDALFNPIYVILGWHYEEQNNSLFKEYIIIQSSSLVNSSIPNYLVLFHDCIAFKVSSFFHESAHQQHCPTMDELIFATAGCFIFREA